MYLYSNNGNSFIAVDDGYTPAIGQAVFPDLATPTQLDTAFPGYIAAKTLEANNGVILDQITALEATVTNRRIREAVTGIDNGWLVSLNSQISTLRASLTATTA